ncbi:MAG: hypothetical protein IJT70_05555 [Clostridia bacterium]|nr:hypothetical protein [Clostridia bacterium]
MASQLEYKCPCCGGAIAFDSTLQKMKCPFCDTEFDVETLLAYDEELSHDAPDEMNWDVEAGSEWAPGETDGMRVYACKSCGGEIVGDATLAATSCPYCGNPVVLMGQFTGQLKPDFIIPFKLDKKAAKEGLMKHLEGKRLLPKIFKDENHIDEIKGIYVPFWLFDASSDATIRYKGTRVRSWSDSKFIYTETSFYSLIRGGSVEFSRVPVDGSSKMEDDLMESIEPFDFSEAVDFQTAYLAGYLADKYDVSADDSLSRVNARVKQSTEEAFASTVIGYTGVFPENSNINLSNGKAKYALYPVWILNTTWNGENYRFAMNGQTGKFVGNLPTDKGAFKRWLFGIAAAVTGAVFLLTYLYWMLRG